MRLAVGLMALFAVTAGAQNGATTALFQRERAVARLYADLSNLRNAHSVDDIALVRECLQFRVGPSAQKEECMPLARIIEDLTPGPANARHAPVAGLALNLVNSLAGRELEPGAQLALSNALIEAVAIADGAVAAHSGATRSSAFRDAVTRAADALIALGVDRDRADLLLGNFARNAENFSGPPLAEPIPPAYR